jgi:hypothetical protein
MADHVGRMLALRGRSELLWSVDAVHKRYLPVGEEPTERQ